MSLLMDALKKAELAKRQGIGDTAAAGDGEDAPGLSLEPLPNTGQAPLAADTDKTQLGSTLSLATHLEELDAQFLEEAAAAARQIPPSSNVAERLEPSPVAAPPPPVSVDPISRPTPVAEVAVRRAAPDPTADAQVKAAAQNLFAAKQPEKPESRKGFAIAIGVLTVISVAGIGGYFWWQLQPKSSMVAKPAVPPPPATQPPPPAPTLAAVSPAPTSVALQAGMSTAPASTNPSVAAAEAKPAALAKPASVGRDNDEVSAQGSRQPAGPRRAAGRPEPDDDSPIRVTRQPLRVDPAIDRGFEAFNRGDLTIAQLEYERARKTDPRNPDILHGLAAIALRQGRYDQAEAYFRQVLESDPQDSVALAALLNQRGQMDPGTTESRLKSLAASQPDLAAPHFSLGNLYARQARWADAQQAYFRAYSAEPDNPDILYNLAISLEHLRQNKLAAQYYAQAVAAASNRPAGFDKAQVAARLKSLQP